MTVQPAHVWVPPHATSAGAEAVELAASLGIVLDAEQRLMVDAALAADAAGRRVAFETCVIEARQNGKTVAGLVIALHELLLGDAELAVWSSHLFATCLEAFRFVRSLAENVDHVSRRVAKIATANGYESIEFTNGRRMLFRARTKHGGRGLSSDLCVLDEAFSLEADAMASLLPTLSARGGSRVVYLSSAGMAESAVLRGLRDRGRAGNDPSLSYVEWASPQRPCLSPHCDHRLGSAGCVLDDVEAWRAANPALGSRITVDAIAAERRALPPAEFARERLGWWDDPGGSIEGVPGSVWAAAKDAASQPTGVPVFAVAVAPDLSWSAIAVAAARSDGRRHVEVVDYRPGVEWVAGRVALLLQRNKGAAVAIEAKGPPSSLPDDLDDAGIQRTEAAPSDVVAACGVFMDQLTRGNLRHIGQPELDVAVKAARRRVVGDGWVWALRASLVDVSPLRAVTLAAWFAEGRGDDAESVYESRGLIAL